MSESRKWDDGLDVPIFVSVTGHVDLIDAEIPEISAKVGKLFDDLMQEYPYTRIIVMSALARGVDQIVSEIAMRRNIHVAPVLPMPIEEYKKTLGNPDAESMFDSIIASPLSYTPYILETESTDYRDSFRNLSSYLIFNSHIMIGLWDGREYNRNGGTYDTLRMAYEGVDADIRSRYLDTVVRIRKESDRVHYLDAAEDCLIYRIEASRCLSDEELIARGCKDPGRKRGGEGYLTPQVVSYNGERSSVFDADMSSEMPTAYGSAFKRIDTMNRDMGVTISDGVATYSPGSVAGDTPNNPIRESRFYLLDTDGVSNEVAEYVNEIKKQGVMDAAADRYHVADQMALNNQNRSFNSIHLMIIITVLTGLSFSVFILSGGSLVVNLIYTLFMLAGIVLTRMHANRKTYSKFIEYRALAESMRVEYYRGLMGSREPVPELCYGYMKNELFWIRSVLKSWNSNFLNDYERVVSIDGYEKKSMDVATECWMSSQKRYHDSKKIKNARLYGRNSHITRILISSTTLLSAILVISLAIFPDVLGQTLVSLNAIQVGGICFVQRMDITLSTVVRIVMIVLVALTSYESLGSSLIHGGTPEQIDAKRQMFFIAEIRMRETEDASVRRKILWELGDQCIDEMNDWVFEHKAKDFKGGTPNVNPMDTNM